MARKRCCGLIEREPDCQRFISEGHNKSKVIELGVEELEAVRLKDLGSLDQADCAAAMGLSRATFQRILQSARRKIAMALVEGRSIIIKGGNYMVKNRVFECQECAHKWEVEPCVEGGKHGYEIACPKCGKSDTYAFSPEQLVHPDTYPKVWDKEEDARHYEVTNELVPGVFITYGMPYEGLKLEVLSSNSSEDMRNNLEKHKDVLNLVDFMALYIRKMVIKSEGSEDIVMTDMKEDILPTVKNMPLDLQVKLIDDSTIDVFTEYNPYYYINIDCGNPACNHKFKWDDIKPENDFFRKALSLYNA